MPISLPFEVLSPTVIDLDDASTIYADASQGNDFRVVLGGNRTLGNPSNPSDGQHVLFQVAQDGTGGRTLTFGTAFAFGDAGEPTLSSAANALDVIGFVYNAAKAEWLFLGAARGF